MQEIILISLFNLVAAIIFIIAAGKMYAVVVNKKEKVSILYFFYGLVFIALYLIVKSLPGIILTDGFFVNASAALFSPLLLIGGMFFFLIPFNLLKLKKIERVYIVFMLCMVAVSSFLNFWGLRGKDSIYRGADYWVILKDPFLDYGSLLIGALFALSLFTATAFYFYFAYQKRKKEVAFGRAIMIGAACLFLFIGGLTENVIGLFVENFFVVETVTSISYIMGAITLVASINYKGEKVKK